VITIKHIAKQLDLSVATVARALTDHPRISRETKDRVRLAAKELGYVANSAARVMRGGRSHLVGLLVPDIRSIFYSMVAQVLSKRCETNGFHLVLSITDDNRDIEMQHVRELISARVAGVIIVPCAKPRRETLDLLRMVPHVQLLRRIASLGDWFGMDDERAILEATNHLLDLGHRRIGYVGDLVFPTGRARYRGFEKAFAEVGRKVDSGLVELGPPDTRFGTEATARLMRRRLPPTAIVTSSVLITLGTAEQLIAMNVDVPGALSIVGFGDGPWQQWWGPGLTTIRLPAEDLAASCGSWFLDRLKGKTPQLRSRPHIAVSRTTLVLRGSTAPVEDRK
jgi:DNA-binding LacI/PurR family transcriptional regulator